MCVHFSEALTTRLCSIWTLCFDSSEPCLPASDTRNVSAIRPVKSNRSCSIVDLYTTWGLPVQYTVNERPHNCLAALDASVRQTDRYMVPHKRMHGVCMGPCSRPVGPTSRPVGPTRKKSGFLARFRAAQDLMCPHWCKVCAHQQRFNFRFEGYGFDDVLRRKIVPPTAYQAVETPKIVFGHDLE